MSLCFRATLNETVQKDNRCALESVEKLVELSLVLYLKVFMLSNFTQFSDFMMCFHFSPYQERSL